VSTGPRWSRRSTSTKRLIPWWSTCVPGARPSVAVDVVGCALPATTRGRAGGTGGHPTSAPWCATCKPTPPGQLPRARPHGRPSALGPPWRRSHQRVRRSAGLAGHPHRQVDGGRPDARRLAHHRIGHLPGGGRGSCSTRSLRRSHPHRDRRDQLQEGQRYLTIVVDHTSGRLVWGPHQRELHRCPTRNDAGENAPTGSSDVGVHG
jgi:hypothetical protein